MASRSAPKSTIADYVNRTSDVSAFQGWENGIGVEALLGQQIYDPISGTSDVVTGTIKLVQRFLLILLTEQGTLKYLPDAGCRFMTDAFRGLWRTSLDVQMSFDYSMLDVQRQLQQLELDSDPPEEKFQSVTILGIVLSPKDRASLRLMLTTQAGNQRAFIAPIDVTPK